MQRIPFGTANYQNIYQSPNKKRNNDILSHILTYLKTNGIILPLHISKHLQENNQSPSKQNKNINDNEIKKLKIELSQYQFELKKISQDYANYIHEIKNDRQKQCKKYEDTINKLRLSIQHINQDNLYKLCKIKQQYQIQKSNLKQTIQLSSLQQIQNNKLYFQNKLSNQIKSKNKQIQQLSSYHISHINQIQSNHHQIIQSIHKQYQTNINQINLKYNTIIQQIKNQNQSYKIAIQSQKYTQQKLHQKTKSQAKKQRQKLISQYCFQANIRKNLQIQLKNKQKQIYNLKNQIQNLQQLLKSSQQTYTQNIIQIKLDFEQNLTKEKTYFQTQLKKLKQIQFQELDQFQERFLKIQISHQNKIALLTQNLQEISLNFEARPSKKQDIGQIDKLKWALAKKDDQARKLQRDLRHCNLQLQNKEQIYTRIFRGSSMSKERRNTPREQKQLAPIIQEKTMTRQLNFRKSQGLQIKNLFKIHNGTRV